MRLHQLHSCNTLVMQYSPQVAKPEEVSAAEKGASSLDMCDAQISLMIQAYTVRWESLSVVPTLTPVHSAVAWQLVAVACVWSSLLWGSLLGILNTARVFACVC